MKNFICHWELSVSDVGKAKEFYSKIFDWEFDESVMPGYTMIQTGQEPGGGMMVKPPMAPQASLNTYFMVECVDATLEKATAAGAQVVVPKMPVPGMGSFAMFLDPDGIPIGIYEQAASEGKPECC